MVVKDVLLFLIGLYLFPYLLRPVFVPCNSILFIEPLKAQVFLYLTHCISVLPYPLQEAINSERIAYLLQYPAHLLLGDFPCAISKAVEVAELIKAVRHKALHFV